MDILWHGNSPTTTSAYGIQTALFVPRIAALGHDVIINGPFSFSGSPIEWEGFTVLPAARDVAGNDTILAAYEYFKRDLIITLCDPFALLKCAKDLPQANVAHLFPVDCNPLGEADVTVLREGQGTPVAISRFGSGFSAPRARTTPSMHLTGSTPRFSAPATRSLTGTRCPASRTPRSSSACAR